MNNPLSYRMMDVKDRVEKFDHVRKIAMMNLMLDLIQFGANVAQRDEPPTLQFLMEVLVERAEEVTGNLERFGKQSK